MVVSDGWVPSKTLKGVAVLARVWGGAAAEPTAGALQGLHGAVKGGGKAALKDKSSKKKKKKKGKKDKAEGLTNPYHFCAEVATTLQLEDAAKAAADKKAEAGKAAGAGAKKKGGAKQGSSFPTTIV